MDVLSGLRSIVSECSDMELTLICTSWKQQWTGCQMIL